MKSYWVIASQTTGLDGKKELVYYIGWDGCHVFGDVLDAMRFDSWDKLVAFLAGANFLELGFNVVQIADVTFEKMKEDDGLHHKFMTPEYALR